MAEMKVERMDADAFLEWCTHQEESYELVDGVPRMMVGARRAHDRCVVNGLVALSGRLKGGPCRLQTEAQAIKIPGGNVRRPDISVNCGPDGPDSLHMSEPVLVIEVLSPSTRGIDLMRKVAEYQRVAAVQHLLLLEADEPVAILHTRRSDDSWSTATLIGPDTDIPLPALGINMKLSEFYE
jgi:Uma2 family endonuclease